MWDISGKMWEIFPKKWDISEEMWLVFGKPCDFVRVVPRENWVKKDSSLWDRLESFVGWGNRIDYFVSEEAVFFAAVEAVFLVVVAFLVVAAALCVGEALVAGASEVASVFGSFRFFQRHHSKCRMNL